MILNAEQHALKGAVVDLDTGRVVPNVFRLNTEEGYLEAYRTGPDGRVLRDLNGDALFYAARGRFEFRPRKYRGVHERPLGAESCARCPSRLTLPGDDLCARCRAEQRGQRCRFTCEPITTPLLDRKCLTCSRLAQWSVADEVDATPEAGPGKLVSVEAKTLWFKRAAVVGRRYYCSACYRPPRLLDPRGEVIREFEDAGGVRPQWHS